MTQALPLTFLLSSAESLSGTDKVLAARTLTDEASGQQASLFQQLLADEQVARPELSRRQEIATTMASSAALLRETVTVESAQVVSAEVSAEEAVLQPQSRSQDGAATAVRNPSLPIESLPPVVTEIETEPPLTDAKLVLADNAATWLGLIQRANQTSDQLEKKLQGAAKWHQLQDEPRVDSVGPVPDPEFEYSTMASPEANHLHSSKLPTATELPLNMQPAQNHNSVEQVVEPGAEQVNPITSDSTNNAKPQQEIGTTAARPAVPVNSLTQEPESVEHSDKAITTVKPAEVTTAERGEQSDAKGKITALPSQPATAQQTTQSESSAVAQPRYQQAALLQSERVSSNAEVSAQEKPVMSQPVQPPQSVMSQLEQSPQSVTSQTVQSAQSLSIATSEPVADDRLAQVLNESLAEPSVSEGRGTQQPGVTQPAMTAQPVSTPVTDLTGTDRPAGIDTESIVTSATVQSDTEGAVSGTPTATLREQTSVAAAVVDGTVEQDISTANLAFTAVKPAEAKPSSDVAGTLSALVDAEQSAQSAVKVVPNAENGAQLSQPTTVSQAATGTLSSQVAHNNAQKTEAAAATAPSAGSTGQNNSDAKEQQPEQRHFQLTNLEVRMQPTAGQQNQTESFVQQLARQESLATSESSRPAASIAPSTELSAKLKQLNLQQQDAAGQLRERVQLMVRQNIQVAEIRLDPAELGQMQIRINLQQEQASVQFIVQQQQAKELLEQQMPRLRDMLQQQGIQLGEGQVQQQSRQQQDAEQRQRANAEGPLGTLEDEVTARQQLDVKHSERLVDYYA